MPASVAQSDACSIGDQEVAGSIPAPQGPATFFTFFREVLSAVILSHLLIQEGKLSASGESMCTSTG